MVAETLWAHAEANTPDARVADYTQAIMDLGATLCTRSRPRCFECPVSAACVAYKNDAVDCYPAARPRKILPVRRARMFVLVDAQERCLLERRPPTGLWGGLWNPPERPVEYGVEELLSEFGMKPSNVVEQHVLPGFRHTFTHFHLDVEPIRIDVASPTLSVADHDRFRWYGTGENEPLGLSAVAVRLLALIPSTLVLT